MKMKIMFLGLVGLAGVITLGAAAQGNGGSANSAKQAQCIQQANEKNFGIHHSPTGDRMQLLAYCIRAEWTDSNSETPLIRPDLWLSLKSKRRCLFPTQSTST